MSVVTQNIIAFGVAALLLMYGGAAFVWSWRCNKDKDHYRIPTLLVLSLPASFWIILKILN